jgi:copper transport protein
VATTPQLRYAGTSAAAGLLLGVLLALAVPVPASAHATLVDTLPDRASVLEEAPKDVRLRFSEVVDGNASDIVIIGPDGSSLRHSSARHGAGDRTTLLVPFPRNPAPGTYTVRWHVLSIDGHPAQGAFRFAYGRPTSPVTGTSTGAARVPRLAWAGRVLSAAGVLALVGLAAFPVLMVPRGTPDGDGLYADTTARVRRPAAVAGPVAAVGTMLVLLTTVAASGGRSAWDVLTAPVDLVGFGTGTRTGRLLVLRVLGVAAVTAMVLRQRRQGVGTRILTGGLALTTLATFALSSHAASAPTDRAVAVGLDLAHLTAASLWSGGLLGLALVGLPAARAVGRNRAQMADLSAALTERFSVVAQLAMLALLATGGYLALLQVDRVRELTDSTWGTALTVKVALWLTVLIIAAVNAVVVVPAIAHRTGALQRRAAASHDLGTGIRMELMLAGALVLVAALMSATPPPSSVDADRPTGLARQSGPVRATSAAGREAGYVARVTVFRSGRGTGAATVFRIQLTAEGAPASSSAASATLGYPDGPDRRFGLRLTGAGEWLSDRLSVPAGRYLVTARFLRSGDVVELPVRVRVPS